MDAMDATSSSRLQQQIAEVQELLTRHRLLESLARRQQTPRSGLLEEMQRRQNLVELEMRLAALHPADVAQLLESVPPDDRIVVWGQLRSRAAGEALVEVNETVRELLLDATPPERLRTLLQELDTDDLRYLSGSLPAAVLESLAATLDAEDRSWVEQSLQYPEGSAARLMTQDALRLEGTQAAADAVAIVRALGALPSHTDRLFVVDSRNVLIGAVPLGVLLIADPAAPIETVMEVEHPPIPSRRRGGPRGDRVRALRSVIGAGGG